MNKYIVKLQSLLLHWSHIRIKERVAIIESDDWGMWRSPSDKAKLKSFGEPKIWGYDQLEEPGELEQLYRILEQYQDSEGKKPFIEANFVVCNPDFEATIQNGYREIVLQPIYLDEARVRKWREGINREVFLPQYHGRLHFNYANMLRALQQDSLSRKIFEARIHGGINNFKKGNWALHSEYQDWQTSSEPDRLNEWVLSGLGEFEKAFGYRPQSTIAPQYIFTPATAKVFQASGFSCIQGTNMQTYKTMYGLERRRNLPIGSGRYKGMIAVGRNVKFEPSRGVASWTADAALQAAKKLVDARIPIIVDSHRINYVGRFADEGLSGLSIFLEGLCRMGVRFLSSFELAEAIQNNGPYQAFFSGKSKHLTIFNSSPLRRWIRDHVA